MRPLIIWLHGGGFKFGSKRSRGIPTWSKTFARRGYTCAAINYRRSKKKPLSRFTDLADGCYSAIQDLKQAVSYFKANSTAYGIDTNKIILAGNSAGAIIALQAVYSNAFQLAKISGQSNPDTVNHDNNLRNIAGVINFWGAIFDTSWLASAKVPIVSVHGTGDNLVPYTHADSPLYGSFLIHREADALGIPNMLKPYPGFRHELQKRFNPIFVSGATHRRWREAGAFAADFLSSKVLK
jgi:acetyl esterase/lipase